jgi:hypothetical protein
VEARTDLAPLYDLRVRTPRLELRLGTHDELVDLGRLAERGVHPPEEMPFAVAWTDRIGEPDFLDGFLAFHEGHLANWSSEDWGLELLVWAGGELETESDWLDGNEASRRVSEKLGYVEVRVGSASPRGVAIREHAVRITSERWVCPIPVAIEGLEPCLPLFGAASPTPRA